MRHLLSMTALAASLAAPAWADDVHRIEEIDVTFDLAAVGSPAAAAFWADLEGDLEEELATRLADQVADTGSVIKIDVDELDMTNSFQAALGGTSKLTADIAVENEEMPSVNSFYELTITVKEAAAFADTDGDAGAEIVARDRDEIYHAAVAAFADGVVKRLR